MTTHPASELDCQGPAILGLAGGGLILARHGQAGVKDQAAGTTSEVKEVPFRATRKKRTCESQDTI